MNPTGSTNYSPRMPREERREQLLDVSLALITKNGFSGLSMEGVAREAGIAKTVVYDTFGEKQLLLLALFGREQRCVYATVAEAVPKFPLEGNPAEILRLSITTALEAVRANPARWRLILLPADGTPVFVRDAVRDHREQLLRQIQPMVEWGVGELGIDGIDTELAAHAILSGAEDAARLTLAQPERFPPERLAAFTAELVSRLASPA